MAEEEAQIENPLYRLTPLSAEDKGCTVIVPFAFPPSSEADQKNSNQLSAVFYNRDFSFWNFQFGTKQKSNLETFDFEMKEYKVDPPTAIITYFKTYTIAREYGQKLTGIRCYDSDNKIVLSVGWF